MKENKSSVEDKIDYGFVLAFKIRVFLELEFAIFPLSLILNYTHTHTQ